jgi:ribosomal-protein-alanine N-acetyltransferase
MEPPAMLPDGDIAIRPWRMDDVRAFRAACQDREVALWTGFPFEMTPRAAEKMVRERVQSFASGASAAFAIVDVHTDELLGSVSLLAIDWQQSSSLAAYWLAPEARGRGVATRALRLLTTWAFSALEVDHIELSADVRNERSHRVAQRAGFRRTGLLRASREIHGEWIDEVAFSLNAPR